MQLSGSHSSCKANNPNVHSLEIKGKWINAASASINLTLVSNCFHLNNIYQHLSRARLFKIQIMEVKHN